MTPEENRFLREFFRAVEDRPLNPDDPAYVGLYDDPALGLEDPVALLARSIEWADENSSAQLLSGFRGAGKSTELRRLRRDLTEAPAISCCCSTCSTISAPRRRSTSATSSWCWPGR